MKKCTVLFLALTGMLHAQSAFRIYDSNLNDVTSGVLYIADTNAVSIQVQLTIENTDSIPYEVTAGKLVLSQPATASNVFTWGAVTYTPNVDSSAIPEFMSAGGQASFIGEYMPNNNGGLATINYCVWETGNMNNNACVTVTFDNFFPAGMGTPLAMPRVTCMPNPVSERIGFGWYGYSFERIEIYSSTGVLMASSAIVQDGAEVDLTGWQDGLYFFVLISADGYTDAGSFLHISTLR